MSSKAIKWISLLLMISGLLLAVPILFHPDVSKPGYALTDAWVPVHFLLGISALAGLAGVIVFYGAMSPKITVVGHVAVWFAIVGIALLAGTMFFEEMAIVPVLAGNPAYEPLLSMTGPIMAGTFGILAMISMVILSVGFIMFGGYLIWAKIISPVNGVLFIIGAPLIAFSPPLLLVMMFIGGVLFGVALVWLGVSIRMGRAHDTLEATLRIHDESLAQTGSRV